MAAGSGLRVGNAEREATAASLREHYAHGRLTIEEFQQRLDATFAAKTELDLTKITSDLPHTPAFSRSRPAPQPLAGARGTSGSGAGSDRTTAQGPRRRRSGPWAWAPVNLAIFVIALFLIVGLFRPLGWISALLPRPLLILAAILIFLFRGLRRVIRGGRRR
jgi:hypothetical protein